MNRTVKLLIATLTIFLVISTSISVVKADPSLQYTITVINVGGGTCSVLPSTTVLPMTPINVTAIPNNGYVFSYFTIFLSTETVNITDTMPNFGNATAIFNNGGVSITSNPWYTTLDISVTVVAYFTLIPTSTPTPIVTPTSVPTPILTSIPTTISPLPTSTPPFTPTPTAMPTLTHTPIPTVKPTTPQNPTIMRHIVKSTQSLHNNTPHILSFFNHFFRFNQQIFRECIKK